MARWYHRPTQDTDVSHLMYLLDNKEIYLKFILLENVRYLGKSSLKAESHVPKSDCGLVLSNLWPHFNLHTSIQCPSRLPHKPCDATEHTGQELQEFYWQWKSHFYCHSDKSGQFLVKKKSPTFHTKTGKYLDLFSIVCSNKILMCLSCLRQLPGGKFDHFKSEN